MRRNRTHEKRIKELEERVYLVERISDHYDVMLGLLREAIRNHYHDGDGVTMFYTESLGGMRVEGHPLEEDI